MSETKQDEVIEIADRDTPPGVPHRHHNHDTCKKKKKSRRKCQLIFVFFHIFFTFILYDIFMLSREPFGVNWSIIANITGFLGLISLYKTWRTPPGFVSPDWTSSVPLEYYASLPVCQTCNIVRPPRSTHCSRLGVF